MPGKAAIVMFEAIQQQYSQHPQQGRVQLICTGALSNAAILLLLYPEVKPMIDITIMGGAMGVSEWWLSDQHHTRCAHSCNVGIVCLGQHMCGC